jgi:hypothetical protein
MGKMEFLDALKRAMSGLPQDAGQDPGLLRTALRRRHVAGRSEEDVAQELDDPKKIAMTLRASSPHGRASSEKAIRQPGPAHAGVGAGLAIFNLFMVVPAMVYGSLLARCMPARWPSTWRHRITASGLAGASTSCCSTGPARWAVIIDDRDRDAPDPGFDRAPASTCHQDKAPIAAETLADRAAAAAADREAKPQPPNAGCAPRRGAEAAPVL